MEPLLWARRLTPIAFSRHFPFGRGTLRGDLASCGGFGTYCASCSASVNLNPWTKTSTSSGMIFFSDLSPPRRAKCIRMRGEDSVIYDFAIATGTRRFSVLTSRMRRKIPTHGSPSLKRPRAVAARSLYFIRAKWHPILVMGNPVLRQASFSIRQF